MEYLESAFKETVKQKPDIISLTGDYISDRLINRVDYAKALRILSEGAPTFTCPGNHDGGVWAGERRGYPDLKVVEEVEMKSMDSFLISCLVGGIYLNGHAQKKWTPRVDSESGLYFSSVIWTGSKLVAVGQRQSILTSPDGVDWSKTISDTTRPGGVHSYTSIAWAGTTLAGLKSRVP